MSEVGINDYIVVQTPLTVGQFYAGNTARFSQYPPDSSYGFS